MPQVGVSRPALHYFLWRRCDADGLISITQTRLADAIGVNKFTINRILKEMVEAGRLAPVEGNAPHGRRTFRVIDPVEFNREAG